MFSLGTTALATKVAVHVLELKNICFSYARNQVINDFNLKIANGEIVALLGPSGGGKSTLAAIISGHLKPSSGKVLLDGEEISGKVWRQVFLVSQDNDLFAWQTVYGHLKFAASASETEIHNTLSKVRLTGKEKAFPKELSGGMKRRLALARAIHINPKVLILDEVFSSLDEVLRLELLNDMKTLCREKKMSVLIVTHDLKFIQEISDRVVRLG